MPSIFVTLVGGSPWGFRIQGGSGTGQPLRLSKVNPGSKASHQGLREGDLLRMVNGYLTDGLSQMDVQNIIKETRTHLTLEIERKPVKQSDINSYSARKTLTFNGSPSYGTRSENINDTSFVRQSPLNSSPYQYSGSNGYSTGQSSPLSNGRNENCFNGRAFSPNRIITDEPPPPGSILVDRRITVEGDKVHTDKYYAIPVKEVIREKTSTTTFISAPPKYEGIGPTEDGIPIAPRQSVKKENMHNWYKTMFKSLHKADSANDSQDYIIGYSSEPETSKKEKPLYKKSSTLNNRHNTSKTIGNLQGYPPSAKSSIEIYNVRPRFIEDYEPGHSSVTDDELIRYSKRYLPSLNTPKPTYEFKNGYEQDNNFIKKAEQPEKFNAEEQKVWYKEIQRGGDIPPFGLGKPTPEKPKEPVIGPLPPPPLNYQGPTIMRQATRPLTLPADYMNQNENGYCQQSTGQFDVHLRQAVHNELQQRISPASSQLSSPSRSIIKSPSRSPDLKIPARTLFDFKAESSKEIALKKGDFVYILRQLDKNWYEGEHQGYVGIFPINYVEIVPPEHVSTTPTKSFIEGVGKALFDFTAQTPVELSVRKNDTVNLLRKVDANWFEARIIDRKGIIPASYLQVLQEPSEKSVFMHSPKSCLKSPSSETRNTLLRTTFYSPPVTNTSSSTLENGKGKFRGKKSSTLIEPVLYKAIYSYSPQNTDELELLEGDMIYVVEMCDDGWYVGTSVRTGIFGIFPGNYVEKV